MKRNTKRILALVLSLVLAVSLLASCGSAKKDTSSQSSENSSSGSSSAVNTDTAFSDRDDISYVMIYNPAVYDENKSTNVSMTTGDFSKWVEPSVHRSDSKKKTENTYASQQDLAKMGIKTEDIDKSGKKATSKLPTYKKGDTTSFYYFDDLSTESYGEEGKFTCEYAGDNSYMWTLDGVDVDKDSAENIIKEFDSNIYGKDTEMFGEARYTDEGGKINILFHPMEGSTAGYFSPKELFSSTEVTDAEAKTYKVNRDHAIIHINSRILGLVSSEAIYGTIAHEFQHLINGSDMFYTTDYIFTSTWLNEAMSGYAEETLYPGTKLEVGQIDAYVDSATVRHGQSLFNFDNDGMDIGVYGSVYYFSEYLAKNAGDDVFKNIHSYWREGNPGVTDAKALYNSVPSDFAEGIGSKYDYSSLSSSQDFASSEEEWMSKMTLDFYISMMKKDEAPDAYKDLDTTTLLYDQVDPASIEGGGRIIVATKDGKFDIPTNADHPLIYVGFDKDFNQVTDPVCS